MKSRFRGPPEQVRAIVQRLFRLTIAVERLDNPLARVVGEGARRPDYLLRAPLSVAATSREPALSAYQNVLALAGASLTHLTRDSVDARVVADIRSRSGRLIDSQRDVGRWPELARGTPWSDSDGDGMPDE